MEPIRGEAGLLSEGSWGGTGDARTGGGVGETPLEAVSTRFASASFMDDLSALADESAFADSAWGGNAPSSVAALMATERGVMLLAMQQEAMGDGGLGELAYPWRVNFELLRLTFVPSSVGRARVSNMHMWTFGLR
jgi:hypothetical protein